MTSCFSCVYDSRDIVHGVRKGGGAWPDSIVFTSVARSAEQMQVPRRRGATLGHRNDVVEFELFFAAALDTAPLITTPGNDNHCALRGNSTN